MRALFITIAMCLFSGLASALENTLKLNPEQISHIGVRVAAPEPVAAMPLVRAPGRVVLPPAQEFVVSALQSGVVGHVNVPLGVTVRNGQVLAEINSTALLDVQRNLLDSVSVLSVARAKLERDDTLLKEGIISRLRWQETRSDFDRAQAAVRAAEQTLAASGMSQAEIGRVKSTHRIGSALEVRAPTDGVVLERMATVGQRVDALAPLFRIGRLDELWLEVDMPQERLHEIKIGDWVSVDSPKASARIVEVGQNVDPQSQTALVRALVEQGGQDLRPGMHINVQLMHRSTDHIFRVPIAAVFSHEGRTYAFVRTQNGFEAREVAVAGQEPYHVVIHEGLKPGEEVAVQGVAALKAAWLARGAGE